MTRVFEIAVFLVILLAESAVLAQAFVLTEPPKSPDPEARYVFYLHGGIVEEKGRRPSHPFLGIYDYDAILKALQDRGYVVISEQRKKNTHVMTYAGKIRGQVAELLKAGVPPERIAVVGFSKGGNIVQYVSMKTKHPIRYALIAGCGREGKGPALLGDVLSLMEKSDYMVGSCQPIFDNSPRIGKHREVVTEIGGGHGAFYEPRDAWIKPLTEWIEQ